jgi:hypothetical protein
LRLKAHLDSASADGRLRDWLGQALRPVDELSPPRDGPRSAWGPIDIVLTTRATFGTLMSLAVYDEYLFPHGFRLARDAVVHECRAILLDSWIHRR